MNKKTIVLFLICLMVATSGIDAGNYVNWKGGFWLTLPDDWEKVDYKIANRLFAPAADSSSDVFSYEAVFAPASNLELRGAYMVVLFDSTGELTKRESDSLISEIASTYGESIYDAAIVDKMTDLVPGKPQVNLQEHTISVMTDMAYRSDAIIKQWTYIKLSPIGLITIFSYCPDSTYENNKAVLEEIVESLSFENLRDAAGTENLNFTKIGASNESDLDLGEDGASCPIIKVKNWILVSVSVIVIFGLIWNFVVRPRLNKKNAETD